MDADLRKQIQLVDSDDGWVLQKRRHFDGVENAG
jgi:hypothetical protein